MKVIYISSPYTLGDVGTNVAVQEEAAHRILDEGHCPIVPLLSHYLHIRRQRPYEEWLAMDLALVSRADIVLRLPGESAGADQEVAMAERCGVPVAYGWFQLWNMIPTLYFLLFVVLHNPMVPLCAAPFLAVGTVAIGYRGAQTVESTIICHRAFEHSFPGVN